MDSCAQLYTGWIYVSLVCLLTTSVKAYDEFKLDNAGFGVELMQIYQYDDFDDCRRVYPGFVYCTVQLRLLPDAASALWNSIQKYSASPRHFDRRTIEVGSCLQECSPSFDMTTGNVTAFLYTCLQAKIWSQYQLNSSIVLARCKSAADANATNESWMTVVAGSAFIAWTVGALLLVIWATISDIGNASRVVKKINVSSSVIVRSFSIRRNLSNLIMSDERAELNLGHLNGIRAITMMITLLSHSSIPLIRMPLKNVDQLEAQFDQSWFPLAMAGNTYTVQLFFVIGGLLLVVNVLQQTKESSTVGMPYFMDRVKNRLIRIFPTYMFVILFHSSWYPRLYDGPVGDRFKDHCVKNWWTNLLFVNNYIHPSEP
uniref:Acyltransferase 3 domain-containing protein n=2 Tax=Anopheles atroparvus TaxID=41427 RepID=A0AAG5DD43_ANOAO